MARLDSQVEISLSSESLEILSKIPDNLEQRLQEIERVLSLLCDKSNVSFNPVDSVAKEVENLEVFEVR